MPTRRIRGAPGVLAMLMLLALFVVAPAARAADPDASTDTANGWKKVLAYARCAFVVFIAVTPAEIGAAMFDCTRLYLSEPPLPGGGG